MAAPCREKKGTIVSELLLSWLHQYWKVRLVLKLLSLVMIHLVISSSRTATNTNTGQNNTFNHILIPIFVPSLPFSPAWTANRYKPRSTEYRSNRSSLHMRNSDACHTPRSPCYASRNKFHGSRHIPLCHCTICTKTLLARRSPTHLNVLTAFSIVTNNG